MRPLSKLVGLALALLVAPAAWGGPISVNGTEDPVLLTPGSHTLTFGITPPTSGLKGFLAIFNVSDPASIVVESCVKIDPETATPACPAGGSSFNFGALDFDPARAGEVPFSFGSVNVRVPEDADPDARIILSSQSVLTDADFEEIPLEETLIASVPEPASLLLLGAGLAGLTVAGRRRSAS